MGKKSTSRKQALPSDDAARAAAAACGVSASVVYALTAAASVGGGDSGELLAEACVGGVAHPPGYGLWLELAAAAFAPDPTRAARRASLMSALCGAAAVWGCARAAATWARHLDEGRHGAIAAVVAGGALLASPLPWEYATHAEVFALNNALVAFGIWCAAALAAHPRDRRPARFAALLVGCCAAHQHASLLTAAPLAAFAVAWLRARPLFMLELFAVAVAAWAYPTYKLTVRSAAATEGSWGDLTTARGVFTHLTRYEYGTFRLGASAPGTAGLRPRVLAYFTWSLDQTGATVLALALVGAGAGALSKNRPARRAARAVSGAWALYTLLWHGIWSNLPIHEPSMAYEVHARFWMQPHLLVCVMAGAGAAAMAARAPKPLPAAVLALCVCVVASRVAALWPALDFSAVAVLATHGAAALAAVPEGGLLLSHTDLHWNPARYLRACEGARPDVTHLSLQLLPYPWFARQHPLHPRMKRWPDVAAASTDPATERYERLVEDVATGNLDAFPAGIYLDLHGVHEPHIGRLGSWRGRWNLVPWGLHYRIVAAGAVQGDAGEWLARSLAEIDRLKAAYEGGPPSPDRFRVGSWEIAAGAAYNDAHSCVGCNSTRGALSWSIIDSRTRFRTGALPDRTIRADAGAGAARVRARARGRPRVRRRATRRAAPHGPRGRRRRLAPRASVVSPGRRGEERPPGRRLSPRRAGSGARPRGPGSTLWQR